VRELKITCSCRKPQILFAQEAEKFYKIDLSAARMLGDTKADRAFAETAGINFQKVTLAKTLSEFGTLTTWQALNLIIDEL
jgi:histidinol phosphatase-like enzyme